MKIRKLAAGWWEANQWLKIKSVRSLALLFVCMYPLQALDLAVIPHLKEKGFGDHQGTYITITAIVQCIMSWLFVKMKKRPQQVLFRSLGLALLGKIFLIGAILSSKLWMYYGYAVVIAVSGTVSVLASGLLFDQALKQQGRKASFAGMALLTLSNTLLQGALVTVLFLPPLIIWVWVAVGVLAVCLWMTWKTPSGGEGPSKEEKEQLKQIEPSKGAQCKGLKRWIQDPSLWIFIGTLGSSLFYYAFPYLLPQTSFVTVEMAGVILGIATMGRAFASYFMTLILADRPSWSNRIVLVTRLSLPGGLALLCLSEGKWPLLIAGALLISCGGNGPATRVSYLKARNEAWGHAIAKISWDTSAIFGSIILLTWVAKSYGPNVALWCLMPGLVLAVIIASYLPLHRMPPEEDKSTK
ncbi:hypothetical protein SAMN05444392_10489 [Seinonella peptonophila]|uniref:Major Facilitator Superfamily protein n=1 Tax=Seinonella peptonophila TaxID=112248 RepID=A0A1M4X2I5_9BACL|nr:hypothetical protein [Seinonella peptonophila]SHE87701.1 hypothetical protein SAMN05444392_10489 [Seinonella peptonophila]